MDLKGKVSIVTGASRGIGKAIAINLALAGAQVVVNYSGSEAKANEVVNEIKTNGGDAIAIKANVGDFDSSKELIDKTIEHFGRIDLLVNNAGITRDSLMMRMSEKDFDDVININLKGVWNCTKHVVRPMMKQRSGKIVNIASIVGVTGNAGQANYVAAKAGVIGMTKTLAKELAPRGINVNAVAPGFIETDMTKELPAEIIDTYKKNIPLQKMGQPQDIANVVLFLASDRAKYITGQTVNVDGGLVM